MSIPTYKAHLVLKAARMLISEPTAWIKGVFARDAEGISCRSRTTNAVCFCSLGAISHAEGVLYPDSEEGWPDWENNASNALDKEILGHSYTYSGIAGFNDSRGTTHAQVLHMFDKAIEATKAPA